MNPGSPFNGQPRQWYMAPLIMGIALIILSILIIRFPMLLVLMIAIPILMVGVLFTLIGLDLWRGSPLWRDRIRTMRWRTWPRDSDE